MTILIIGATGTLGRQVVRETLNEGYQIKCLVRNIKKATFLKEWGAEIIYGDLSIPETIPPALYGIRTIIDVSTTRTSDSYNSSVIDLQSKKILINSAKQANIKRFIFCSFTFVNNKQYQQIALVKFKKEIEMLLANSNINYTIFRMEGFFQGLISQYAIPILENKAVWITSESTPISYINTQDVAKFITRSLYLKLAEKRIFNLTVDHYWTSLEIIQLCERLSGKKAKINYIPVALLKSLKKVTQLFKWSQNIAERLTFIEILSSEERLSLKDSCDVYKIFNLNSSLLDKFFQDYFNSIMKKVKELNYSKKDNINQF